MRAGNIFINDLRDFGILERVRAISRRESIIQLTDRVPGEYGENNLVRVPHIIATTSTR